MSMNEAVVSLFWSLFALVLILRALSGIAGLTEAVKILERGLVALVVVALVAPVLGAALGRGTATRLAPSTSDLGAVLDQATSFTGVVVVVGNLLFLAFVLFLRRRLAARRNERERVLRGRERVQPRSEEGGRR